MDGDGIKVGRANGEDPNEQSNAKRMEKGSKSKKVMPVLQTNPAKKKEEKNVEQFDL